MSYLNDRQTSRLWAKIKALIPTSTSQLTNDSGYVTQDDIPEGSAASQTTPKMDGTATTGSENAFARGDHVHPTDTSRQAKVTASGILKGDGSGGVSSAAPGTDYQAPLPSQTGNTGKFLKTNGTAMSWEDVPDPDLSSKLDVNGDGKSVTVTFSQASNRTNIASGNTLATTLGRIKKWLADLGTLAFKSEVAKTDLASGVRDSLDLADSALQSYTETDPTVPSWAKQSTKPSYTYSEVGAAAASHAHAIGDVTGLQTALNGKQDALTFDTTPTSGSTNPVTSGGVYTELETVKTSVSNGKSAIASAITDKGVSTSGSDSFATMAINIGDIQTGHTITIDGEEYDNDVDLVRDLGRFEVYSTTLPANLGYKYTLRPNLIVYNNELYKIGESFTYGTSGAQSYITRTVQKWDGSSWTGLTQIPISNLYRFGLVVKDNVIHYYKAKDSTISHYTFNGTTWTLIGTENVDLTSFSRTINSVYCIHNAFIYNDTVYLASFLDDSDTYFCLYFMKYNGTNWVQATELGSSYLYRMKSTYNSKDSGIGANNISNFVVYNNEIHYLVTYKSGGTWKAYRFKNGSWSTISSNLNSYNNISTYSNATSPMWLEVHNDSICCAMAVNWGGGSSNPSPNHYSLWYKNSTWNNKRALIPVTPAAGEASGFISWNGELHYIGASATSSSGATKFWYKFIENYVIE